MTRESTEPDELLGVRADAVARERILSATFLELADTFVSDFDIIDYLTTVAERSVELLDINATGIMLADRHGEPREAAASNEDTRLTGLLSADTGEGPWWDCFRTGAATTNFDLTGAVDRWPQLTPRALALGHTLVTTVALTLRDQLIGALTCFHTVALDSAALRLVQALGNAATIAILQQRTLVEHRLLSTQLQTALDHRVIIEQAKGFVAARYRLSTDQAFHYLRRTARSNDQTISELARSVLADEPETLPSSQNPAVPIPVPHPKPRIPPPGSPTL
ncbi:MAG: hypothetical protein JWR37_1833 [Mycobacterium sp.]|nr:hypothetical protein [Mycobacterium sp.]